MTQSDKELMSEIREFALRQMESHIDLEPKERNRKVIAAVKRKYDVILSDDQVYRIWKKVEELQGKLGEFNKDVKEKKPKFEVRDGNYYLYTKNATFKLSVEEVDSIFRDYSKYGANLSGEEMMQKYGLKPEAWQALKSHLRLYKASHVISPHTAEVSTEDELNGKVEEAVGAHHDRIREKMIVSNRQRRDKEGQEAIRILSNVNYFLDHLKERLASYQPKPVKIARTPDHKPGEVSVFITDTHFKNGKFEEVNNRLAEVADDAIRNPAGKVNIFFLGDLAETLCAEMMHDSQARTMNGHDVFDTIIKVCESLQAFIMRIAEAGKEVSFHGIGGNHDRISRLHDQDIRRTGALIIFDRLQLALKDTEIAVNYYLEKVNSVESGNLNYVFAHGDDGFSNRKIEEVLWKNGRNDKYNVVVHGDKHTLKMAETKNGMMIGVPAMAGEGDYDKRLDLHSEPGAIFVSENRHKTADVTVKRLAS